jgi:hypothetical protein
VGDSSPVAEEELGGWWGTSGGFVVRQGGGWRRVVPEGRKGVKSEGGEVRWGRRSRVGKESGKEGALVEKKKFDGEKEFHREESSSRTPPIARQFVR